MANYPVKWYSNTMGGIPALSGTNGALTTILDAVLVNGFNIKSVTNVYINGTVAEIVVGASHGYLKDQIVTISGANESAWNTDYRILAVSGNSFFIDMTAGTGMPTGTLQVKVPPLGYEITHSATFIRCYRSLDNTSRKFILRIDDGNEITQPAYNAAYYKKGRVTVFKDTTAIDQYGITGDAGKFYTYDQMPFWDYTTNLARNHTVWAGSTNTVQDGWFKWYYATNALSTASATNFDSSPISAGNRDFHIIGDSKGFWIMLDPSLSSMWSLIRGSYYFGEFESFLGPSDTNNCILLATDIYSPANTAWQPTYNGYYNLASTNGIQPYYSNVSWSHHPWLQGTIGGAQVFKDYTGLGTSKYILQIPPANPAMNNANAYPFKSGYDTGITWPNGFNYTVFISPINFRAINDAVLRGTYPGIYAVQNNVQSNNFYNNGETIDNVINYSGKKFMSFRVNGYPESNTGPYYGRVFFDITGPWRS